MIQIKYGNNVLFEVLETPSCERVVELMSADHVRLSWVAREGDAIPAGAYITYQGEVFTLLDEYKPSQKSENEFEYTPEFGSSIMAWGKVPFFFYTVNAQGQIVSREMDWSLTGGANVFLDRICDTIEKETRETYTYSYDTDLPGSKNRQFSSVDILSALNDIANVFETEWWVDKANKVIHLSKCEVGTEKTLTVGGNVHTPSVQVNSEGFYNRYYAFGSTRNIVQSYTGANVNNLVNKRLTLDPNEYPDGYYEPNPIPTGGKVFSKILIFDDIYPAATNFVAYDILSRQEFVLDESTGKKIQIGTDDDGNPIYDMYAVYYIKVGTKSGTTYTQYTINPWEYSEKEDRQEGPQPGREGQLLPGLNVSVHFDSGSLRGREFEVRYVKEQETYSGDTPIIITPGYFEIKYTKDNNYIIPDITSLFPKTDDKVILFNLRMPDEYIEDAYGRLEEKMLETIEKKFDADLNLYTVGSNPIAFKDNNPNLGIGSKVALVNGDYTLHSRVTKLSSRLDFPYVQDITIGNSLVKGSIQELKEEVTTANTNLEIIATLNSTAKAITDAYTRTQQTVIANFAKISDMFVLDEQSIPGTTLIKAKYGLYSLGEITAGGIGSDTPVATTTLGGLLNVTDDADDEQTEHDVILVRRKNATGGNSWTLADLSSISGTVVGVKMNGVVKNPGTDKIVDLGTVITSLSGYATENWVLGKNYLTSHQSVTLASGTNNGTLKLTTNAGTVDNIAVKGLAALAFKASLVASDIPSLDWSKIATGKPTTISGYGITDAYTKTQIDAKTITVAGTALKFGDSISANTIVGAATSAATFAGTAAKATILATARSIWGHNFDGSAAISGDMSSVGKMTFTAKTSAATSGNVLEVVTLNGVTYLHTTLPFFSDSEITAGGVGSGGGGGAAVWGGITGTLSNQTDLWNVLQGKQNSLGTGTNGQILSWQNGSPAWVAAPATGVTSLGGQTGAITVRGGQSANGSVNLAMSGTQLQASIVGLGSLAYLNGLSKSDVGLGNVENKSSATIRGELTASNVATALGYTPYNAANIGSASVAYATSAATANSPSYIGGAFDGNNPQAMLHSTYNSPSYFANRPDGWNFGQLLTIPRSGNLGNPLAAQFTWDVMHGTQSSGRLWFRTKDEIAGWRGWSEIYHSGNLTSLSQLSTDATHRIVTDTQITAWNAKWDYNENTIKAVKVNNAGNADTLESHSASYFATASSLGNYLLLSGGTMSGAITGVTSISASGIVSDKGSDYAEYYINQGWYRVAVISYGNLTADFWLSNGFFYVEPSPIHIQICRGVITAIGHSGGFISKVRTVSVTGSSDIAVEVYSASPQELLHIRALGGSLTLYKSTTAGSDNSTLAEVSVGSGFNCSSNIVASGNVTCSNLTASGNGIFHGKYFSLGALSTSYDSSRMEFDFVHASNDVAEFWFGNQSTRKFGISLRPTSENYIMFYSPTYGNMMDFSLANGNVTIHRNLYTDANIVATGEVTAGGSSDIRLKNNIQSISRNTARNIVNRLRGVTFTWNELATSLASQNKGDSVGFVAQEIQPLIPSAIGTIFDKYLRLDTTKIIPYAVTMLQDHDERIAQLERENAELKMEIQRLRS